MLENNTHHEPVSVEEVNKEEVILLIPIVICLALIAIIGLPGNGLVCYVYGVKSTISTSSRWFIFFLGSANLVTCVIIVPGEVIPVFFQYNFSNNGACKATAFFNCSSLAVMVYTLVIVAIDRYRKVCSPHGWQIKLRTAKILTSITVVAAVLTSAPLLWVYGVKTYVLRQHNITVISCAFSEAASTSALTFYYAVFGMTLTTVCLATMCILYCFVGWGIRRQLYKQQKCKQRTTGTNNHGVSQSTSRRNVIEVFRLKTLKKNQSKADNSVIETKPEEQNDKPCIGEENSTTSVVATCEGDDTLSYYHKSTSQLQPHTPMKRRRSHVRKTAFSLFLISLAFVLSYLPTLICLLIRSINGEFEGSLTDTGRAVYKFFIRICWLYCATNPFLLALSDSKFRTECKNIVNRCWKSLACKT